MSWRAIANFSSTLDKELTKTIELKRSRDAAAEIPNIWSDFVMQSSNFLENAQNHLNVTPDNDGAVNCLTAFPQGHEDFKENNKPFSSYVLNKLDVHASNILKTLKNPITQNAIQKKIDNYKVGLAQNLASTEAKLVHDKRYSDSIDGIDKISRSTYIAPHLFEENLATSLESINHLSITPSDKHRLQKMATDEIAYSAALSTLHNSPELVQSTNINESWKKHLSMPQIQKLEYQATQILESKKQLQQSHAKNVFKSHLARIKEEGREIAGALDLARNTFGQDSEIFKEMQVNEELARNEYEALQVLKSQPLDAGLELVDGYRPQIGDPEYQAKLKIYERLKKNLDNQYTWALKDPARYVEDLFPEELAGISSYVARLETRKLYQSQKGITDTKYMTLDEKNLMLAKLNNDDPNIVKQEIDKIVNIGETGNKLGLAMLEEALKDDRQKLRIPTLFHARACMLNNADLADDFANITAKRKELFSQQSNSDQIKLKSAIESNRRFQEWKRKALIQEDDNQGFAVKNMYEAIRHLARYHQIDDYNSSNRVVVNRAVDKLISDDYIDLNKGLSIHLPLSHLLLPKKIIHEGRVQEVNGEHIRDKLLEKRKEIIEKAKTWKWKGTHNKGVNLYGLDNGYFVLGRDGKTIKYLYLEDNKRKFAEDPETGKNYEINLID